MKLAAFFLAGILAVTDSGEAKTIYIPQDYPTIQAGIDAALHGDALIVAPGTYVENIDFHGKAITVKSSGGATVTHIDGNRSGSVVAFKSGENLQSVLSGFTVTNGSGTVVTAGIYKFIYGAGIYCDGSSPAISGNHIFDNKIEDLGWAYGYSGGGIFCANGACPAIEDNLIEENQANLGGAIFCVSQASPIIRRNTILNNQAVDYHDPWGLLKTGGGAAICCHGMVSQTETDLFIEDNIIQFNLAQRGAGAIRLHVRTKGIIRRNHIRFNGKQSIACNVLHSVLMEKNAITDTLGGNAIKCWNVWPGLKIMNNQISRSQSGSGIRIEESQGTISGNIITENTSTEGAGLYLDGGGTVVNNIIAWNTATGIENGGGGILIAPGNGSKIINNTLVGNTAAGQGGGISAHKAHPKIFNTIVWNNVAPGNIEIFGNDCTVEYCCVEGGWSGGTGNIDSDPLFVDSTNDDFHLTFTSPCRASGDSSVVIDLTDFEGDPRIAYGTVDIGADEFHTHLYWTGDATPGGNVEVKFVGLPGTTPVGLCIGSGVLDPPLNSIWGDWYLHFPIIAPIDLGSIPSPEGVLIIPGIIPYLPPPPYSIPMQALIGAELTNLCLLEVE